MDPFEPRPAFDVRGVVRASIERDERPVRSLADAQEELVEDLAPCQGVHTAAVGQHALDVEEACPHRGR